MPDIPSISGNYIPIGNERSGENKYSKPQAYHAHRQGAEKLRMGEIVFGTIVETLNAKESLVRLPIGTLRAYLVGKLQAGDTLYFRVEQTEPNLILRIHSVPVAIGGRILDDADILRVLNLPNNEFYSMLVGYLRTFQVRIQLDTALWFWRAFTGLKETTVKHAKLWNVLRVFRFFYENKLLTSDELFTALYPFIAEYENLSGIFNEMNSLIGSQPDQPPTRALAQAFSAIMRKQLKLSDLVKSCACVSDAKINFSHIFTGIVKLGSSGASAQFIRLGERACAILESQYVFNRLATSEGFASEFLIPFYFRNAFIVGKLILVVPHSKDKSRSASTFVLEMPTESMGTVRAECSMIDSIVSIELESDSEQSAQMLRANLPELRAMLERMNFHNASVGSVIKQNKPQIGKPNISGSHDKTISFVV